MNPTRTKACRTWGQHLVEAVYDELDGERRREFEAHLESCPGCRAQLDGFESTTARVTAAMPRRPRPWQLDLWQQIAPQLDVIDQDRSAKSRGLELGYPSAAFMAAALLLLGLGFGALLSGVWRPPTTEPTLTPAAATVDIDTESGFARFLERSTPMLLAVANRRLGGPETASFDAATERQLAERLAFEARELAEDLDDDGLRRQAALLRDLEVVFLQLANLPEQQYRHGLAVVQTTLERRALLFQLSVEEMRRL